MASNPRIDDLRRRLEKEPNSRLFAQLAEELRKDGEFEEAIRIARAGLARHPAYPSARMTLGRALFDTGDMAAARHELQSVLDGAPDNILASRLLAECLEALGDVAGALARYRSTLALSPGDKQLSARIRDLEGKVEAAPPTPAGPAAAAASPAAAEPAPIPLAAVDEPMVLETSHERPAPEAPAPPVPVAEAPTEFELESAYDSPGTQWQGGGTSPPVAAPPPPVVPVEEPGERTLVDVPASPPEPDRTVSEATFEYAFDTPAAAAEPEPEPAPAAPPMPPLPEPVAVAASPTPPAVLSPEPAASEPAVAPVREEPRPFEPPAPAAPSVAPVSPPAAPPRDEAELVSPTLAELYFNQGFPEKAVEVYRRLLEREPGNDRARARLAELQQGVASPGGAAPPAADTDQARAARRQALERTIERLESLRAALQKGAR